nr:hypothetical protein Iba_chr09cCG5960 [Ipomoea batatas]
MTTPSDIDHHSIRPQRIDNLTVDDVQQPQYQAQLVEQTPIEQQGSVHEQPHGHYTPSTDLVEQQQVQNSEPISTSQHDTTDQELINESFSSFPSSRSTSITAYVTARYILHNPFFTNLSPSQIFLSTARINPIAMSATSSVRTSGVLIGEAVDERVKEIDSDKGVHDKGADRGGVNLAEESVGVGEVPEAEEIESVVELVFQVGVHRARH